MSKSYEIYKQRQDIMYYKQWNYRRIEGNDSIKTYLIEIWVWRSKQPFLCVLYRLKTKGFLLSEFPEGYEKSRKRELARSEKRKAKTCEERGAKSVDPRISHQSKFPFKDRAGSHDFQLTYFELKWNWQLS